MRWTAVRTRWSVGLCVTTLVAAGLVTSGAQAAPGTALRAVAARLTGAESATGSAGSPAVAGAGQADAQPSGAASAPDGSRLRRSPAAGANAGGTGAVRTTVSGSASGDSVVVVRFRSGVRTATATSATTFTSAVRRFGARPRSVAAKVGAVTYRVPKAQVSGFVASMRARADVASARTALLTTPLVVPDDTAYAGSQASYMTAISAPTGWDWTKGSADVKVAIIDSGVDVSHPDLTGKVVGRYNAVDGGTDVTDTVGHGTFVAGVVGAATNNSRGVAGIGWNTRLLAVKVADQAGDIFDIDIANGIRWAADNGAKVANISLGRAGTSDDELSAIRYAQGRGMLVVASAGNSAQEGNPKFYPAAYPGVVSVGATDAKGHRAWFSEYGTWVTMAAPGIDLRSTSPAAGSELYPPNYATSSGTSFSSPLVAGTAALLLARSPTATSAQVVAALTTGGTGYRGLGLGAGQLNVARSLSLVVPTTTSTLSAPAAGATVSGTVTLTARAGVGRAAVGFYVDGTRVALVRTTVSPWNASFAWPTWGWAEGTHTVEARDCTTAGLCSPTGASRTVTLDNAAPALSAPADGATVSGPVAITATSPGGGLAVLVDGARKAFDGAAPFALEVNASALTDASHTVEVVQCNTAGTRCAGARSAVATVTSSSLHPTVTTVTNAVFSPNKDAVKETTTVTYSLPSAQRVSVSIRNSAGTAVRTVAAAAKVAGAQTFTWNGVTTGTTVAPGGTYSIRISTTDAAAPGLKGLATASVRLDKTSPKLTAVGGTGTTFYPVVDGYRDTFVPKTTLSEKARLTLTVKNSAGTTVRTISQDKPAPGATSLTWDGKNGSGTLVPAGRYTWRFTATDLGGTRTSSAAFTVTVSKAKLTTRTSVVTLRGAQAYDWGGSATCATAVATGSTYAPKGKWLKNNCPVSNPQEALAFFTLTMPSAIRYTSLKVTSAGSSHSPPSDVQAGIFSSQTNDYDVSGPKPASATTLTTLTFATFTGAGHVVARKADVVVWVPNYRAPLTDWDISNVTVTVVYQVAA